MRIVRNRLLPPRNYAAINLFGVLFCRKGTTITTEVIRHERIHTRQMLEMAILPFYLWYFAEWLIRLRMHGRAYLNISFEREAYAHMHEKSYLDHRKPYAWTKYLSTPNRQVQP